MSGHTDRIDANLERIMNAAGSSLRHYMPSSRDKLREAMAEIEATHLATIEALVGQLTVARTMLEGYAEHDDEIGCHEDAHYTRQRIAEIDSALSLVRGDR